MKKAQQKIIDDTLSAIKKQFGPEAAMLLGQQNEVTADTFSTGSLVLNELVGIGGYPRGRVIEIYGPESSGKTTLSLHAIAEIQKIGGVAAFIDVEHAIDPVYARNLGVDVDRLIIAQPDSGEQALEIANTLAQVGAIDLIVVDSVAALTPEAELNGEMTEHTMGGQARLMAKALRKMNSALSKNQTTIIFINQIREKIGVIFGNPETTPGGRALKFFASLRIEIRRIATLVHQKKILGNHVKMKIVKNKLAPPFKIGTTEIIFTKGISQAAELINLAEQYEIVQKAGAWYKYQDQNLAQGKHKLRELLEQDQQLYQTLLAQIVACQQQKEAEAIQPVSPDSK